MPRAIEWSSSTASDAETFETFPVLETAGSRGGADPSLSAATENLLVYGKSEGRLLSRGGLETVIGPDERVRVSETNKLPWRMIAALRLVPRPPLTSAFIGTGWFIGPKTLLTAGHCVYSDTEFNGWIGAIEVSAGRNGDEFPFATVTARRFSATQVWQSSADPDYDIGCIHLDEPLGDTVGYFKIASLPDPDLKDALINISGYPADRGNGEEQYFHANRVLRTSAKRIYYDVDTYGGQSGSPVWRQASPADQPLAVAVHAYGVSGTPGNLGITANSGPRLTPEIVATIKEWLAADTA